MILALTATFLFQAVDTYFVGMLGTSELAAISFTFPVTFTLTSTLIGMGIATSVVLAQAIGEDNNDQARLITGSSLALSAVIVIVLAAATALFHDPLFAALGASENLRELIWLYMWPTLLAMPLFVAPMVGNAAIRATGDTRTASRIMVLSGLVNVGLDPLLIFGYGPVPAYGIQGAAFATAASWLIGMIAALWVLIRREHLLAPFAYRLRQLVSLWRQLADTAVPIVLANTLTPIAGAMLTAIIASNGEYAVAAFGAGSRIESISLVACFAMTAALSPFMAQNLGAGQYQRADDALFMCVRFAFGLQIFIYLLLAVSAPTLASLFSQEPEVVELTSWYLWLMPAGASFYAVVMMFNTGFNAERQSGRTLKTNIVRLLICVVPIAWAANHWFGTRGFFAGASLGNFLAMIIAYQYLRGMHAKRPARSS